ncbi:MAG: hypothetical protein J7484_10565 [Microbacterium sp.]|nr:hypothetical protein [Microbacterium sp.]
MGIIGELGAVLGVVSRVLVSASTALFVAYVLYIVGMLSATSIARTVRRALRRRRVAIEEAAE